MKFQGGFVGTVVGSLTNNITPALSGALQNPGSYAVKDTLTYAVKDVAGLSLQAGQNYALTQISSALPKSLQSGLAGEMSNAFIKAGLDVATNTFAKALPKPVQGLLVLSNKDLAPLGRPDRLDGNPLFLVSLTLFHLLITVARVTTYKR